jgi:hypothetical protein
MENYMMNNGMVGERLSALQRNMVEQRSDYVQAQTGLDTLKFGGEEASTGAIDSSGLSTGLGGAVFDKSVSKIKNFALKRGKQALVDRVQPEIDKIKQAKADGTLGQQTDAGTQPPAQPEPPSSSTASGTAEDELFGNLPSTKAEAQQKIDDISKQSGTPDTLEDDGGADFSTPKPLGGTQTKFQTGNLDTPSANLSQADTTLTEGLEGGANRSGQILRSFRATQTNTGDNIADAFRNDPSSNLFSQQTTTLQPQQQLQPSKPTPDPAPDPAPDTTPPKPSTLAPETNELDTELSSTKNALSDKAMSILKGAGVDTGDLTAEELASGLGGKAGELLGDTGSTILGRIGGFLGDAMDFLGPLGEIAGIGMSIYGAIEGNKEADAEENAKNQLAQVSAHINDMGGMSMGSMSLAPMDTETFRGGGSEGNF